MADPRCTIRVAGEASAAHWHAIAPVGPDGRPAVDLRDAATPEEALDDCARATADRLVVRVLPDGSTFLGVARSDDDDPRAIVDRLLQAADPTVATLPDAVLDAWRDHLLADPPSAGTQHWGRQAAALRGDGPAPSPPTDLAVRRRPLPEAAGVRLDEVARAGAVALQAHVVGRWSMVAARADGRRVQAVSVVVDRRTRESLRRVVGRTRRWVPVTVRVDPESSLADLDRVTEDACRAAERWQELLPADHPLPPVAIDVACWPTSSVGSAAVDVVDASGWLEAPIPTLRLVREPAGWHVEARNPADLDPAVDAWLDLLAIDRPEARIGDQPLGTPQRGPVPEPVPTLDRFAADLDAWRRERPDDPAVVDAAGVLTVASLWHESGLVADQLRPGDVVGIRCDRDRSFAVAVVGCLRARACFVPVDGRAGDDRFARADVGVVVDGSAVVRGDGPSSGLAAGSAYAMATSGSMGAPKIALVPRPMLAAAIHRVGRLLRLDDGDRYLHLAVFGFSSSIRQLLVPLANRAAVLLCDDATRTDPDALAAWLHRVQPTVLDLTPTMLDALGDAARPLPESVRTIICASERLDPAVVRALREEQGFRGTIFEGYGTTETSGLVAAAIAAGPSTGEEGWPLAPLDGCRLRVLDRYLHPVAPGMVGELWVSVGRCAAGYVGAAATATAFLPDPASCDERMFRTGDVVRREGADSISWVGRADDVVKVRGERVSLLQVAAAAEAHPAVHRAHAILAEGSVGLGVAIERGLGLEVSALQHHLREAGLGAGLPTRIAVLDAFPVNESGKVDRGALRRAIMAGGDQRAPVSTPATDTERRLLAIWEDLLPDRQLGTDDDFFDVGGHSLKAAQLTNRIRDAFERPDVGVIEVFEHPTIRSMAHHLDRAGGTP